MSSATILNSQAVPPIDRSPPLPVANERHYAREDFEFGSLLGIGALAQVVHVRDTFGGDEYALKILDKKQLRRVCLSLHFCRIFLL